MAPSNSFDSALTFCLAEVQRCAVSEVKRLQEENSQLRKRLAHLEASTSSADAVAKVSQSRGARLTEKMQTEEAPDYSVARARVCPAHESQESNVRPAREQPEQVSGVAGVALFPPRDAPCEEGIALPATKTKAALFPPRDQPVHTAQSQPHNSFPSALFPAVSKDACPQSLYTEPQKVEDNETPEVCRDSCGSASQLKSMFQHKVDTLNEDDVLQGATTPRQGSNTPRQSTTAASIVEPSEDELTPEAICRDSCGSASQLKGMFQQKVNSLKEETGKPKKTWSAVQTQVSLPSGTETGSFRAHDAPYKARASFDKPLREKRNLSDLLDKGP